MTQTIVIKLTGHRIDEPDYLATFAQTIAEMSQPVIIVHGGGKEISSLMNELGMQPTYVEGLRVTDEAAMAVVTMVLCGTVNKRLVHYLLEAGMDAQGISGVDRGLITAQKLQHSEVDYGLAGEVVSVRGEVLTQMLQVGITPVVSPVSGGIAQHYNVNGDHVAGAIADAVNAEKIIFLSNVEGVLVDNEVVANLTPEQTQAYITDGTIYGGMIPKVEMALHALESGVPTAVITNLTGLQTHGGTQFTA
ncbi:MAG: acetylglutamate kinase [Chloroflexota bacterium]